MEKTRHLKTEYLLADKAVMHWTLILAGSLSATQRQRARLELVRAVGRRVRAKADMEQEIENEVVMV